MDTCTSEAVSEIAMAMAIADLSKVNQTKEMSGLMSTIPNGSNGILCGVACANWSDHNERIWHFEGDPDLPWGCWTYSRKKSGDYFWGKQEALKEHAQKVAQKNQIAKFNFVNLIHTATVF